ncbi:MAG: hypothetical protein KC475_05505 [Cyanobacteria bacterium HKST-UBA03]|nr:hypothetical protein [Cyanobacteria bacterium HKST-UBA03]
MNPFDVLLKAVGASAKPPKSLPPVVTPILDSVLNGKRLWLLSPDDAALAKGQGLVTASIQAAKAGRPVLNHYLKALMPTFGVQTARFNTLGDLLAELDARRQGELPLPDVLVVSGCIPHLAQAVDALLEAGCQPESLLIYVDSRQRAVIPAFCPEIGVLNERSLDGSVINTVRAIEGHVARWQGSRINTSGNNGGGKVIPLSLAMSR